MKGYVYLFLTDGMLKMITELEEYNGTHYDNIQARVDTAKVMRIMEEHSNWDYELTRTVVCNYAIKPFFKILSVQEFHLLSDYYYYFHTIYTHKLLQIIHKIILAGIFSDFSIPFIVKNTITTV